MSRGGVVAILCIACAVRVARADVVSERAMSEARQSGRVAVVVALAAPPLPRGARLSDRKAAMDKQRQRVLGAVAGSGLELRHAYSAVAGFSATVDEATLRALGEQPDVLRVDLDGEGGGSASVGVPQIRADRVQNRLVDGSGVVIAVLDTGVDATHPDVAGALLDEQCFCTDGCCPNRHSTQSGTGSARSGHEHGVHVTAIALSRGQVGPRGTAPGASLVSVKVLDDGNRGFLSDWIAGLDWVIAERPDVRAINMSLASDLVLPKGCNQDCAGESLCAENMLFFEAIAALRERGTLVFVAAGNSMAADRLSSPACVENAISVGAVDDMDHIATFSNGGALVDLLAPGVAILSDGLGGGTAVLTGTSMSTPHATGTAALLAAARPGATADDIERAMRETGKPISANGAIAPRIDAFAAFHQITRAPEHVPGGGGRTSDCLVEWSFVPVDVATAGARPAAHCSDGDAVCDHDTVAGQCTFEVSLCFNVPDPLLPRCDTTEDVLALDVDAPRASAPAGSIERLNADALRGSLPLLPLQAANVCGVPFPFVVPRPAGGSGVSYASLAARSATRVDRDRLTFVCDAP